MNDSHSSKKPDEVIVVRAIEDIAMVFSPTKDVTLRAAFHTVHHEILRCSKVRLLAFNFS